MDSVKTINPKEDKLNPLRQSNASAKSGDGSNVEKLMPTVPNYNTIDVMASSNPSHPSARNQSTAITRKDKPAQPSTTISDMPNLPAGGDRKQKDNALREFFRDKKNLKA